ncbi:MAG: hydroxymethylpyrimidine/phosphomethylpyrimidine kinase [Gammaproteobacteria bacterium]|nr:MAG: hydroxymethylpyrimidine/phosphomethylpyrimidine kinase [Gammaproteobacteria bacterium]
MSTLPPVVLVFAGHDPTGGAGIIADTQAIHSLGGYAATIVTALTNQNSYEVKAFTATDSESLIKQADTLVEELPIAAIKLGMLGSSDNAKAIMQWRASHLASIPLIVDPVLASDQDQPLSDDALIKVYRDDILPQTTLLTPNVPELYQLSGIKNEAEAARALLQSGCSYILVSGSHRDSEHVDNMLYDSDGLLETITVERLPGHYHGSGCTLASACATAWVHGLEPVHAVAEAIDYTWQSLQHAYALAQGSHLPNRLYWTHEDEE